MPQPALLAHDLVRTLGDRRMLPHHFDVERKVDVVEQLIPLAEKAGLPMTHVAMAFAIAHPGVTSAIIGPGTMEQLDDLLASTDVTRAAGTGPPHGSRSPRARRRCRSRRPP